MITHPTMLIASAPLFPSIVSADMFCDFIYRHISNAFYFPHILPLIIKGADQLSLIDTLLIIIPYRYNRR